MYREALVFELKTHLRELQEFIHQIDERISSYRSGSLVIQNDYAYIKRYENGKMVSTYIGKHLSQEEISNLKRELANHKTLKKRRSEYIKECHALEKIIHQYEKEENK